MATYWPLRAGSDPGRIATTLRPGPRSSRSTIDPESALPAAPLFRLSSDPRSIDPTRGVIRIVDGPAEGAALSRSALLRAICGITAGGMRCNPTTNTAAAPPKREVSEKTARIGPGTFAMVSTTTFPFTESAIGQVDESALTPPYTTG